MSDNIRGSLNDTARTYSYHLSPSNKKQNLSPQNSNEKPPIFVEEDSSQDFPQNQLEEILFRKSQLPNKQELFTKVVREFQFDTESTQPLNKSRIPAGPSQKAKYVVPSPSESKSSYRPQFTDTVGEYTTNFTRNSFMNQSKYNPLEETFKTDFSQELSYDQQHSARTADNRSRVLEGTLRRNSAVKASGNAFTHAMKALQGKVKGLEDELKKTERSKRELANQLMTESQRFAQHELEAMQCFEKESEVSERVSLLECENKKLNERISRVEHEKQQMEKSFLQSGSEKDSLLTDNRELQAQLAENAKVMADFIAREKTLQETHARDITGLKLREEAALEQIEQLKSRIKGLEQENADSKKIYKDHLQELVSKNETLTRQLESCKKDYSQQILDFESELINIEESHNAKVRELTAENDMLQEKVAEMQKTLEVKIKENEELRGNLDKCFTQIFESSSVSPNRQTQSMAKTPAKAEGDYEELTQTRYQTGKPSLGLNRSINDWHTPGQYEADLPDNQYFRSDQSYDWPSNQKPSRGSQVKHSKPSERNHLATPVQTQPRHSIQVENSPRGQPSYIYQQGSMSSPYSQKQGISGSKNNVSIEPTFRNLEDNRGSNFMVSVEENGDPLFMESVDSRRRFSYAHKLSTQPLDLDEIMQEHQLIKGTAKFNGAYQNLSFGRNDFDNRPEGQALRNTANNVSMQPKTGMAQFNLTDLRIPENKTPDNEQLLALVQGISDLEQELQQKNKEYGEILAKAQQASETKERMALRGRLVFLTEQIQKLNKQLNTYKRQEQRIVREGN